MRKQKKTAIAASIGCAADLRGEGVAYARLRSATGSRLLRMPFQVQRYPGLDEREIGYAALTAIAAALRERGIARVRFEVDDEYLVRDVNEHRDVPAPLVLPYVRLGCALNRFDEHALVLAGDDGDLRARARAEVAMHLAA